jgi:ribose 1,5-bisphosphokinase
MSQRLIYTIGPSGAGKDSVLAWLRQHLSNQSTVHFARRVIDRPAQLDGEINEYLSTEEFIAQRDLQAFALNWTANRHHYGVRHTELAALKCNQWVFVNGSRAHLDKALELFPSMVVLHITAPLPILEARLVTRSRESTDQIAARLSRVALFQPNKQCTFFEVQNDKSLEETGYRILQVLTQLPEWM